MKPVFILTLFFLLFSSCDKKQAEKKETAAEETVDVELLEVARGNVADLMEADAQEYEESEALFTKYFAKNPLESRVVSDEDINSTKPGHPFYTSILREGEKLPVGTIYTDEVEYVYYDGNGDYHFIVVKKDGVYSSLYVYDVSLENINRGDVITLNWKMGSYFVAGDGDSEWIAEWVVDVSLKSEGKLSKFLDAQKDKNIQIPFIPEDAPEWQFSEEKERIFSYLANTPNKTVRHAVDADEKLLIDVSSFETKLELETNEGRLSFYQVDIKMKDELQKLTTLYLSQNYADNYTVYEYDKETNELNKFSIY